MRYTDAPQRRDELLKRLTRHGYVSSRQAAHELGVTEMTIRRDLDSLVSAGVATRVVGGARRPAAPFSERSTTQAAAKQAIALRCGDLFSSGMLPAGATIALDAGTTVAPIVHWLPAGVTVVSHSVPVLAECATRDDLALIGLGGSYQQQTRSFGGPETRRQLADLRIDVAILSASAIRATGLYCQDSIEADTKRAILDSSETIIVVADRGKLNGGGMIRIADWSRVGALVTSDGQGDLSPIADQNVRIEVAEVTA